MRDLPTLRMVIVGRPHSMAGIDPPENVTVFTNLPQAQTWAIAAGSRGMIIPLRTDSTACGHITLIGAQMLGIPLVITRSHGVEDYVTHGETARLMPAAEVAAMRAAIMALVEDLGHTAQMAATAQARALSGNGLDMWLAYFREIAARYDAPLTDRQDTETEGG